MPHNTTQQQLPKTALTNIMPKKQNFQGLISFCKKNRTQFFSMAHSKCIVRNIGLHKSSQWIHRCDSCNIKGCCTFLWIFIQVLLQLCQVIPLLFPDLHSSPASLWLSMIFHPWTVSKGNVGLKINRISNNLITTTQRVDCHLTNIMSHFMECSISESWHNFILYDWWDHSSAAHQYWSMTNITTSMSWYTDHSLSVREIWKYWNIFSFSLSLISSLGRVFSCCEGQYCIQLFVRNSHKCCAHAIIVLAAARNVLQEFYLDSLVK